MNYGEFERRRVYAKRRVAMAMKKWGNVDPWPETRYDAGHQLGYREQVGGLTFMRNGAGLEKLFPGCSAAWDANPVTRSWEIYDLLIREHEPLSYLRGPRSVHSGEAMHHAKLWGHHVLFAAKKKDHITIPDLIEIERHQPRMVTRLRFERTAWYVPQEERWTVIQ